MASRQSQREIPENLLTFVVNSENFNFIQQLAGGNDEIWLSNEKITGQNCLSKRLLVQHLTEEQRHQYYQEVIAFSKVNNQFVTNLIGFTVQYPYCIFTEYLENASLYQLVHLNSKEKLNGTHLTLISMGIACGMAKLHELRLIEPTLSTSNIIITPEYLPKICHFNTSPKQIKWKAPELISGTYGYKSDVFAYALILYELLTRKDPFASMTKDKVIQTVCIEKKRPQIPSSTPEPLTNLIKLCWSNDPNKRPSFFEIFDSFENGDVSFPGTEGKAVIVLSQRIRNNERVISNTSYISNNKRRSPSAHATPAPSISPTRQKSSSVSTAFTSPRKRSDSLKQKKSPPLKTANGVCASISPVRPSEINRNDEKSGIDLHDFQNYNNPSFFTALKELPEKLDTSQYRTFFKLISKYFASDCPIDVLSSILDAISQLIAADQDAISAFVGLNLQRFLPYDEPSLINLTFNVLFSIFDSFPEVFQYDYASIMSLLIIKNPEKALTLLSLFGKAFNDMEDPWSLLDLLFKYDKVFYKSAVGSEYISLLFFLNFTFSTFYQSRISNCRPIFVHFLNSTDKFAVQTTYRTICALYDDLFQIPMDRMVVDVCDSELFLPAISVMLRMKDVIPSPELIYPLIHIAETNFEATLLLLKLLKTPEAAKILLMKPHWLFKSLPTIQDTLRLFLSVMKHSSLRDFISTLNALPEFITSLIKSNDKACLVCLGSIIKRLNLQKEIIPNLIRLQFFNYMLETFVSFKEEIVTALTINVLTHLASIGFTREYLLFTDRLKSFMWSKDMRVSRAAFLAFYTMSFYPQCALKYKEQKIDEDVTELFKNEKEKKKVRIFIKNILRADDY